MRLYDLMMQDEHRTEPYSETAINMVASLERRRLEQANEINASEQGDRDES